MQKFDLKKSGWFIPLFSDRAFETWMNATQAAWLQRPCAGSRPTQVFF
jgi:hypothetical protein